MKKPIKALSNNSKTNTRWKLLKFNHQFEFNFYLMLIMVSLITLSSCTNNKSTTDKPLAKPQNEQTKTQISLSLAQQKSIGIEIDQIVKRNLRTSLKANGKLMLPPQNQANVSLPIGGIVKAIDIEEGAFVTKGKTLAKIQNTDFIQMQQDFLLCKSQLSFLKAEFERQKELQKDNINAAKIFQKAEADYQAQLTNYNSLKQKLNLYNVDAEILTSDKISNSFPIIAPISGYIHNININIGTFAEPNKPLFNIVDSRYLHIDLSIFEKDISKILEGQKVLFTDANHTDLIHNAMIFSINKAFETGQQAVIAHAKILDVNETLLPGMFIEARIIINDSSAQSIQESAIVSNGNDHYIFVQREENVFKQVQVRIGASDLGFTEIFPYEEILPTQKIVVKGAYNLLSELNKDTEE